MSATVTGPEPAMSQRARRLILVGLVGLAIAAATPVVTLGWEAIRAEQAEQDLAAAVDAARSGASQAFSYDSATLDADLARARGQLAGVFAEQYEEIVATEILPASRLGPVSSRTEVTRSALADGRPDRAEVLLYLSRTASTAAQPQPTVVNTQFMATMSKAPDGRWLLAEMQPL